MRKPTLVRILCGISALVLAGGIWWLCRYLGTYTWVNSVRYRRDAVRLDLTGAPLQRPEELQKFQNLEYLDLRDTGLTPETYEQLHQWLPECEIVWSVPFHGQTLDSSATTLTVSSLEEADLALLDYLPGLADVDATDCRDYEALDQLRSRRPELAVHFRVSLAGTDWDADAKAVTVADADSGELMERLKYLPNLERVNLLGQLPAPGQLEALAQAYPDVDMQWFFPFGDVPAAKTTRELEISDTPFTVEALETLLDYTPVLERLTLLGSGLSNEELAAVEEHRPGLRLVWDMTIGDRVVRTDQQELDLSGVPFASTEAIEDLLPYFPDAQTLLLCGCGLPNEELAELRTRHEEQLKVVWTIRVGKSREIRTDAAYFMPFQLGIHVRDSDLVDLGYCTEMICVDVGHMSLTNCNFVATMPHLKYLIIADTRIQSLEPLAGLQELIYLETFLTQVTDYTPLLECPALEDLNLCYTGGDPQTLLQMPQLKRLWWGTNRSADILPVSYYEMLKEGLPNTQVEFTTYSTGNGWRNHQNYRDMRDILGMTYFF